MSFDTPADNAAWAADEDFPFELWSDDSERTLALTYGAAQSSSASSASRVTMILDAEGVLVLEYRDNVSVGTHPAQVLEDVNALFGP